MSSIEDMENYLKDETDLESIYIKNERKIIIHKAMITYRKLQER